MHARSSVLVFISVLVVVLAVVGTLYLYEYRLQNENRIAGTPVGVLPAKESGYSGWKVYSNNRYGFEFAYPPGTTIEAQEHGGSVGLLTPDEYLAAFLVHNPIQDEAGGGFFQPVVVYRKPDVETLQEWFSTNFDFQGEIYQTTVNNYDALDVRGGPSDRLGVLNAIFISNNTLVVELDRSGTNATDQPTEAQERLYASFRFSN